MTQSEANEQQPLTDVEQQAEMAAAFQVLLNPGQRFEHVEGIGWVISTPEVMAAPIPEQSAAPAPGAPQAAKHPELVRLLEHERVTILEVLDRESNVAHIRATISGSDGEIVAGCGLDQIMDRSREDRLAWCKQVVWDHFITNIEPRLPPSRIVDLDS